MKIKFILELLVQLTNSILNQNPSRSFGEEICGQMGGCDLQLRLTSCALTKKLNVFILKRVQNRRGSFLLTHAPWDVVKIHKLNILRDQMKLVASGIPMKLNTVHLEANGSETWNSDNSSIIMWKTIWTTQSFEHARRHAKGSEEVRLQ
jgi:hypothetical protein